MCGIKREGGNIGIGQVTKELARVALGNGE